ISGRRDVLRSGSRGRRIGNDPQEVSAVRTVHRERSALNPDGMRHSIVMRLTTVAAISVACATVLGALSLRLPQQFSRADLDVLDAPQPIPFFIQDGTGVPGYVPNDRELARWALEAWSRESGGKLKFVESSKQESALIRLRWVSAREGLFGETQHV